MKKSRVKKIRSASQYVENCPITVNNNRLSGGVEFSKEKISMKQRLVKENFMQLTLGLTYRDFLFSKGKKYD